MSEKTGSVSDEGAVAWRETLIKRLRDFAYENDPFGDHFSQHELEVVLIQPQQAGPDDPLAKLIRNLQSWRDEDHADEISLNRNQVITIIEGARKGTKVSI